MIIQNILVIVDLLIILVNLVALIILVIKFTFLVNCLLTVWAPRVTICLPMR